MSLPPQADPQAAPAHGQLFTVRVWAEVGKGGQLVWRIKVQHVLSGEARFFHDWQAVVNFLTGSGPLL